jgi:hypothetical protein
MTRFAALLCAVTLGTALPALAETTWTGTGPNGGTTTGSRDCSASGGSYACSGQSTYVGPEGRTRTRAWQGTGTRTEGQRTGTVTAPNGETRTRTFNWQRNN